MLDAGDLFFPEDAVIEEEVDQRRVKAELIAAANAKMGIDAIGVGDQDLALGVEYLKHLGSTHSLPVLSANLVTAADGKTVFPPHLVKSACGTKIGIFSVLAKENDRTGKATVAGPIYRVEDPFEVAKKEVAALRAEGAEIVIALTHLGLQEDLRFGREVKGVSFVFGGHSMSQLEEPQRSVATESEKAGPWIFQSGYRGKWIGRADIDLASVKDAAEVVDLSSTDRIKQRILTYDERITELTARIEQEEDPDRKLMLGDQINFYKEQRAIEEKDLPKEGATSTLKNHLADLSREISDDPKTAELVEAALTRIASLPPSKVVPAVDAKGPEAGPYVGSVVCQACHQKEWQDWSQSGHAKAYQTLVTENHHMDFDCVGCHVTGYKQEGGPKDPFTVSGLTGVQCETCHGPGRSHATDPKKVDMARTLPESGCRACHSMEQTGDRFVLSEYLPKIDHGTSKKKGQKAEK